MAQESKKQTEIKPETPDQDSNLVTIKAKKEGQVLEINKQMKSVESSIDKLNKKLNETNRKIKSDITRLTESDAEITDKVTDTYKQLGVIEGTFKELNKQSDKVNSDLKKVNVTIKALEKSSAEALNSAIETQTSINDEFKQAHDDIIDRAEKLAKKATTISNKLNKSIKDNSQALTELEARIVSELETIAHASENRDLKLEKNIEQSAEEINSQKAKMMLMQSVDEALDKRAAALETTSNQLLEDSASLKQSSEMLTVLTAKLSTDVEALEIHTTQLAEQNQQQQGFIEILQEKTSSLGQNLLSLATREKKHFRIFGVTSALLLLAIIGLFVYGEYMRSSEITAESQRNAQVSDQVKSLQGSVRDEQLSSQTFYEEISTLKNNISSIKQEMQGMNDQVESLDGRVQYMAPLYNFGSDNTIHGSQWLIQLKPEQYSIKIATVSDQQDLYDIAQRYSYYFDQDLAYFMNAEKQLTLIYGGKFESEQQVNDVLRHMPRYMNNQRPGTISNSQVLQQIKI